MKFVHFEREVGRLNLATLWKILEMLREYYKVYKPTVYLFEGQTAGTKRSEK
ncbi:hypothetical protein J2X31_003674 [Flavobacterium arsenatis]|uniref:Uncharacterized protein n=1 Tax=Flavobacterium arsenatis TaxID=1484332 RepID=A0ABU1TUV7_9FLAO|nr:hypothetical protein [Flavobacterium arsenatis]